MNPLNSWTLEVMATELRAVAKRRDVEYPSDFLRPTKDSLPLDRA